MALKSSPGKTGPKPQCCFAICAITTRLPKAGAPEALHREPVECFRSAVHWRRARPKRQEALAERSRRGDQATLCNPILRLCELSLALQESDQLRLV